MPVTRYADVRDVPAPAPRDPRDPAALQAVFTLLAGAVRGLPPMFAPGVYRYRTIAEADAAAESARIRRMRRLAAASALARDGQGAP